MSLKNLMIIKAIVCICFAPILLFVPEQLLNMLGAAYSAGAALTSREYGATLIGNFALAWFARNAELSVARRAIILDLFLYDAAALVATLLLQLSGGLSMLGWGVVIIYLFFSIGFGYQFFRGAKIS